MKKSVLVLLGVLVLSLLSSCMIRPSVEITDTSANAYLEELSAEQSDEILSQDVYLPIGTVVTLENYNGEVMVVGVLQVNPDDPEKVYDYSGVIYPAGYVGAGEMVAFNNGSIKRIVYMGYWNEDQDKLQEEIERALSEKAVKPNDGDDLES